MNLQQILKQARDFLEEPTIEVSQKNVTDTFEGYTTGAAPTAPWVNTGGQPPRVETYSGTKHLKVQANGANGAVGIDISKQTASDTAPIVIQFDLIRAVASADAVNLFGVNENATLNSDFEFQLLRLTAAATPFIEVNSNQGWINTASTISVLTTYAFMLKLYKLWFEVYLDETLIFTGYYPGDYQGETFGYAYFLGNNHATANVYVNDFNSTGPIQVIGEATWSNEELAAYANEAVQIFRAILPQSMLDRYTQVSTQDLTISVNYVALPDPMQRFLGATLNGYHVSMTSVEEHISIEMYLGRHYLAANMSEFPSGWLLNGRLYFYPAPPATVVGGAKIYYLAPVTEMDFSTPTLSEPELPEDLHKGVVWWTAIRAREKTGDDTAGLRADLEALLAGSAGKVAQAKAG